ncbi:MAG: zincin-like metallopeptidase domain-containing protein [Candidatus Tectomicrobia bacterium]|nr:zincin-like metallopeptidase domain-containing protein [Candidatus Tectomicrobia bacterium]
MKQSNRNGRVTVYEQVTRKITELLEQGVVPWQKPWNAHVGPPRNGMSGRSYRGFNVFMLSFAGFDSPWWFTPRQVNDLDGHIVKGERVSWVSFFKPWLPKNEQGEAREDDAGDSEGSARRRAAIIVRAYRVVNVDQCTGPGIDRFREKHPVDRPGRNDNDPIAGCEQIVTGMPSPPAIRHGGNRACYWPHIDQISMPKRETFVSSEAFYSTLFHELTHSTGHPDRLNRKTLVAGAPFRSPTYTREELCAEMGAAFLCATAGIQDPTIENSASYLQGWLKYLSSDPKALLVAGAQAQKAADFVLGHAGVEEVEAAEELAEAAA